MLLNVADIITSLLQAIMFVTIPNFCVKDEDKNNKKQLIFVIIATWLSLQIIMKVLGNTSISIIVTHLVPLAIIIMFYKKDKLVVVISYSTLYLICGVPVLLCSKVFFNFIQPRIFPENIEIGILICVYFIQYILAFLVLTNKKKIYRFYRSIKSRNFSIIFLVILTLIFDFVASLDKIINWDEYIYKNYIFLSILLFMVIATIYFANIEKKMREIANLNIALGEKIEELKKVKHDYGAQISYLYGLHLMKQYERAGELLKDIINGHNSIDDEIEVANNSDSIISIITKSIVHSGINIILDEHADLNDVQLTEFKLQKVISNIINNSVTAMNGKGVLTVRTYENMNSVVIRIQNDGPMIEESMMEKIFNPGFSTKCNTEKDHGFGLAIVKEIVESCDGNIYVLSDLNKTEFTINLPRKIE